MCIKDEIEQEQTEDWLDHIINRTIENYNGREIVIWGSYEVSDFIKDRLKEKHGIDIAFYIDSDLTKTDEREIFSPEYLSGKSDKYYVIIPIAFYQLRKNANFEVGTKGSFSGGDGKCILGENAFFKIGKEFSIAGGYRIMVGSDTSIFIGDDCMFSYDIRMRSHDAHSIFDISTKRNINSSYSISKERRIIIGNHVWVGERAEILYNTQIGDGSIIGAMSLVKSKIPNNCIVAGIPARVIRKNVAWSRQNGTENIMECGEKYINYTEEL